MKSLLAILSFFLVNGLTSQTTWYISSTGSNSNSGLTANDAFSTVNQAIGDASCGDSIYILAGNFHEKINAYQICPENNRIIVQGDVNTRPLITGDSTVLNKYAIGATGSGFVFRHLELTSPLPNDCAQSNMIVVGSGDYFDFLDIKVHHAGYDGIKTTSNCTSNDFPEGWRIIDSEVYDNGLGCPASIVNGDGIDFTNCRNCLIENTIIKNNKGHQIQVKLEARNVTIQNCHIEGIYLLQIGVPGNTPQCDTTAFNADSVFIRYNTILAKGDTSEFVIKMADVSNLYIENNTIVKNEVILDVGFICFGGCGSSANWQVAPTAPIVIRNNIFYSAASMPFYAGPDTTFYDPLGVLSTQVNSSHNLFYDTNGAYLVPPDNSNTSFVADPQFCDFPNTFELTLVSPCINTGDPTSLNDPDGSLNDIGARYFNTPCLVAINDLNSGSSLKLYPNPNTGNFSISISDTWIGAEMHLYNVIGQKIASFMINEISQDFNLTYLDAGMYHFQLSHNKMKLNDFGILIKK